MFRSLTLSSNHAKLNSELSMFWDTTNKIDLPKEIAD